jgi:Trypsin-co-occurring domain 1
VTVASQIVRYQVDDSTIVGFEFDPGPDWHPTGTQEMAGSLKDALAPVIEAAKAVMEMVKEAGPPEIAEIAVEFGVKVTGEAGWVVAKVASEANFAVRLTWKPSAEDDAATSESAYLLRSPENARRLLAAIDRLENGGGTERDLLQ